MFFFLFWGKDDNTTPHWVCQLRKSPLRQPPSNHLVAQHRFTTETRVSSPTQWPGARTEGSDDQRQGARGTGPGTPSGGQGHPQRGHGSRKLTREVVDETRISSESGCCAACRTCPTAIPRRCQTAVPTIVIPKPSCVLGRACRVDRVGVTMTPPMFVREAAHISVQRSHTHVCTYNVRNSIFVQDIHGPTASYNDETSMLVQETQPKLTREAPLRPKQQCL